MLFVDGRTKKKKTKYEHFNQCVVALFLMKGNILSYFYDEESFLLRE